MLKKAHPRQGRPGQGSEGRPRQAAKAGQDQGKEASKQLKPAEKRVEQEGLRLRTKYQGVRREAPPPSDGPNNYFAEHGVLIGGCVAGGLAAVFALSRVLARFS